MDEKIALQILNFLLQKPIDDKIINRALSSFPIADNNYPLKKMILLRCIASETKSKGSVSEKILEFLEIIEELDFRNGKSASKLMKNAYCAVAVDCTVRFLEEKADGNPKYLVAIERVWKSRVCKMESLKSEESNRWLGVIESAVYDTSVCERILMKNTRNEALKAVRAYLNEAWKIMGPSFLELVAMKVGKAVEELRCSEKSATQVLGGMKKHVTAKSSHPVGANTIDADDEDIGHSSMSIDSLSHMDKLQEVLQTTSTQLQDAVADAAAARAPHTLSFMTKVADNLSNATFKVNQTGHEINAALEDNRVQDAIKRSSGKLQTPQADPVLEDLQTPQTDPVPGALQTPQPDPVPEALQTPQLDHLPEALQTPQTDPLPEALQTPQTAVETKTQQEVNAIHNEGTVEQAHRSSFIEEHFVERCPCPDVSQKVTSWADAMETNHTVPEVQPRSTQSHICGLHDSIDNPGRDSPHGSRLPPNSKKRDASPLEQHESVKYLRRETKKWSPREVEALMDGVRRFGKGKWKYIRLCYDDVFKGRTEVDLKDKWRNLNNSRT